MSEELLPLPEGEEEEPVGLECGEEEVRDEEDDDETMGDYKDDDDDADDDDEADVEDEAEEPCEVEYDPDAPPARAAPRLRKRETPDYSHVPTLTRED